MVIAFLAVSCDNAAGGKKNDDGKKTEQNQNGDEKTGPTQDGDGKTDPDQNGDGSKDDGGLNEALAFFKEEFGLEIAEDDLGAITITMIAPMLIMGGEDDGLEMDIDQSTQTTTITFTDYKITDEDGDKTLTVNGTYTSNSEGATSKITVTGSTNGPVKSNFTISGDEESEELPELNGTLTIGSQTFDMDEDIYMMIMMEVMSKAFGEMGDF